MNPAVADDAAAVSKLVAALESSLYGTSTFSQPDLELEWSELELEQDARVVREDDRIVGYGLVRDRGERWRVEGCVHPDAHGRGIGRLLATELEADALRGGARRIHNSILEPDSAARRLLESLGYVAVRVFRELRIELKAPPATPEWPGGLRVTPFDPARDAIEFHAAHQEAFADSWDYTPRDYEAWSRYHLASEKFDPTLWCVVRDGDEIAAGTIGMGDTYGGGWVRVLFTRRRWRRRGVGAALLADSFRRFWERGEQSVGLSVDAANDTGAFRLYERAGMAPLLGWVTFEKELEMTDDQDRVRDFARRYAEAWGRHDPAEVASFYAPAATIAINGWSPTPIADVADGFISAFPDIQVFMDDVIFKDEAVEFHWTFTGTNTGPGGTGRTVRIAGFERWTFGEDGLISESKGQYDQAEYDRQLEQRFAES